MLPFLTSAIVSAVSKSSTFSPSSSDIGCTCMPSCPCKCKKSEAFKCCHGFQKGRVIVRWLFCVVGFVTVLARSTLLKTQIRELNAGCVWEDLAQNVKLPSIFRPQCSSTKYQILHIQRFHTVCWFQEQWLQNTHQNLNHHVSHKMHLVPAASTHNARSSISH